MLATRQRGDDHRAGQTRFVRLIRSPGYPPLAAASFAWNFAKWGGYFTTNYIIADRWHSPMLSSIIGSLFFLPMLLGGAFASLRGGGLRPEGPLVLAQLCVVPLLVGTAVALWIGAVAIWLFVVTALAFGLASLADVLYQRRLLSLVAGSMLTGTAMTVDAIGQALAALLGTAGGGAVMQTLGFGPTMACVAATLTLSAVLVHQAARCLKRSPSTQASDPTQRPLPGGLALLKRDPGYSRILFVTASMNFCCFSFTPLLPAVAERLTTGSLGSGLLASAAAGGQLCGSVLICVRELRRPRRTYLLGSIGALAGLAIFAGSSQELFAMFGLVVLGLGQAWFAATQSYLAVTADGGEAASAALGLMASAIGILPAGILALGAVAAEIGAQAAMAVFSTAGLALVTLAARRPRANSGGLRRNVPTSDLGAGYPPLRERNRRIGL